MSDTMRAFVIKEVGRTEVMEKPIPTPGPEEAIVKTTAALICTSDVHTVKGALPVPNDRTLGHESVGVIHSLGSAVTGFTEGQRVAVNAVTPCYRCSYCQRGFTSQCGGALGGYKYTIQMDGNMAEYFVVPAAQAGHVAPILDAISTRLFQAFAAGPAGKAHPAFPNLAKLGIKPGAHTVQAPDVD